MDLAADLGRIVLDRFEDRTSGGFFFTGEGHESLVHRPKPVFDGSIPSGNSAAVEGLLRLFHYTNDERFFTAAERALRAFAAGMSKNPFGFGHMLAATDFYLRKPREVVIVGRRDDAGTRALRACIHAGYVPNKTVVVSAPDSSAQLPVAKEKPQIDGRATAYVCHGYTCSTPVTTPDGLAPLLEAKRA